MEITSTTSSVKITIDELLEQIPDEAWSRITKNLLKKVNMETGKNFTSYEDTIESNGTVEFLVSQN